MSTLLGRFSIVALSTLLPLAAGCEGDKEKLSSVPRSASADSPAGLPASYTAPTTPPAGESTASVSAAVTGNVSYTDAEAAFEGRRYAEAEQLFTAYTEQHPANAWGHYMLGLSAWKAGNLAQADTAFIEALRLDPSHMKSLLNSARVLLDLDRATDALARVEQALAIDSTSPEAFRLLGRARHELGRTDEAIEAYHRALALDERDAWAMNNLGLIYIQLGRYQDALGPLARATELRSDVPLFAKNLSAAINRSGHDATFDVTAAAQTFATQIKEWQAAGEPMVRDTADLPE